MLRLNWACAEAVLPFIYRFASGLKPNLSILFCSFLLFDGSKLIGQNIAEVFGNSALGHTGKVLFLAGGT